MSEQEYRSAVQQLESHTQELNGKVNRVVDVSFLLLCPGTADLAEQGFMFFPSTLCSAMSEFFTIQDLIHVERSAWDRAQSTMIDFLIQLQQWHEQNAAATAATIDRLRQLSLEQMLTSKSVRGWPRKDFARPSPR